MYSLTFPCLNNKVVAYDKVVNDFNGLIKYLAALLGPTASHVQGSILLLLLNFEQGKAAQIVDALRAECPPTQRGDVTMADVSIGTAFGPINLEETKSPARDDAKFHALFEYQR